VTNSGGQESVSVQVPCETTPGSSVPVAVNAGGGTATVNIPVQIASPGIFETPMSDGVRRAVMVRADGSFVSLENPARRGEVGSRSIVLAWTRRPKHRSAISWRCLTVSCF
jgi:uncharacterized protein (TIGR03437 family)